MNSSVVSLRVVGAILCSAFLLPAHAQKIFRDQDLTEQNLIEALMPARDAPRTRGIKVERDAALPRPGGTGSYAERPGAALLVTFVTNSAQLTPEAQWRLDVVGRALQAEQLSAFKFAVEGHADPRGRHDYNMRLSEARAESVVEYLAARHHVARARLMPIGKGDTQLANAARPAAPENRRVTLVTVVE